MKNICNFDAKFVKEPKLLLSESENVANVLTNLTGVSCSNFTQKCIYQMISKFYLK